MAKTVTFKVSTVGILRLRSAAVQQGLATDEYEWARRYIDALGISWSDRGISGGSFLTGSPSQLYELAKHAKAVNAIAENKAIENVIILLESEEAMVPNPKKLPKGVVTRHFRIVRFSDGIESKLVFDRMQNGELHVHAPGRVAVKVRRVGGLRKPFRATVSNKQKSPTNIAFGMGGGVTEREAYRNLVGSFARVMGW